MQKNYKLSQLLDIKDFKSIDEFKNSFTFEEDFSTSISKERLCISREYKFIYQNYKLLSLEQKKNLTKINMKEFQIKEYLNCDKCAEQLNQFCEQLNNNCQGYSLDEFEFKDKFIGIKQEFIQNNFDVIQILQKCKYELIQKMELLERKKKKRRCIFHSQKNIQQSIIQQIGLWNNYISQLSDIQPYQFDQKEFKDFLKTELKKKKSKFKKYQDNIMKVYQDFKKEQCLIYSVSNNIHNRESIDQVQGRRRTKSADDIYIDYRCQNFIQPCGSIKFKKKAQKFIIYPKINNNNVSRIIEYVDNYMFQKFNYQSNQLNDQFAKKLFLIYLRSFIKIKLQKRIKQKYCQELIETWFFKLICQQIRDNLNCRILDLLGHEIKMEQILEQQAKEAKKIRNKKKKLKIKDKKKKKNIQKQTECKKLSKNQFEQEIFKLLGRQQQYDEQKIRKYSPYNSNEILNLKQQSKTQILQQFHQFMKQLK